MKKWLLLVLLFVACGDEKYSTPEKTLSHYISNKTMGSAVEINATISCFSKEAQAWWSGHYMALCEAKFGAASRACEDKVSAQSTVWGDSFEHFGPESANVSSSDINDSDGTATVVVDGRKVK